jgi:hypothetical protein
MTQQTCPPCNNNCNQETLNELLKYDPETGKLLWCLRGRKWFATDGSCNAWNVRFAGKEAFTTNRHGYLCGAIFRKTHQAHRIIWILCNGEIPDGMQIDHINGDKLDNRLANLRIATNAENCCNRRKSDRNTSGVKGVSWHKQMQKWRACIRVEGKLNHLGLFASIADAEAAYLKAAEQNQGQFACHRRG